MEENKVYSVVGKVEIGTDEYRDLIETCGKLRNEAADAERRRWDQYQKTNDAEKKVNELQKKVDFLAEFREFVSEKYLSEYKLWKLEKEEQVDED